MTETKKTYTLGKARQLIDLNGETVNFEISFRVTTLNKEPFEVLVTDQNTLDNTQDMPYKKAEGEISGNIVQDSDVFQNYLLILRAENPCECEVEIHKKEIPKALKQSPLPPADTKPKDDSINWLKIAIIVLLVAGAGYLVYRFVYKAKTGEKSRPGSSPALRGRNLTPQGSPQGSPIHSPANSPVQRGGTDFLARLKRLNLN